MLFGRTLFAAVLALCTVGIEPSHAEDRAPKVDSSRPTPVTYPMSALGKGEEGIVVVRVHVGVSGKPIGANLAKTSGFDDLDMGAIETAMNWHYLPAIRDGATTDDWALVQVVYKLQSDASNTSPSSGEPRCIVPSVPAVLSGTITTKEQMDAAHIAVAEFLTASDSYQRCLGGIMKDIESQIASNQRQKETVGKDYNDAVTHFHANNASP